MLQISELRKNPTECASRLAIKQVDSLERIYGVIALDDLRRRHQTELDTLLADINTLSKQVGNLMSQGNHEQALELKNSISKTKKNISDLEQKLNALEPEIQNVLITLPNLPHPLVKLGKNPEDNEIIFESSIINKPPQPLLGHWDLLKKFQLGDFEIGAKLSGSGFSVLLGDGSKLQRSLVSFFLDYNTSKGYLEVQPPLLVNADSAYATGQLPDKEGQMYYVNEDKLYLIPTSEVPLTNMYRNQILMEQTLPIKLTAFSNCFRREAGSFGKEVRGLNRLHQFEKVEIVQLTQAHLSMQALDNMVLHVKGMLEQLELPFRILRLCGGDMSFASAITYDFEVYSFAQERWLEVSSVSNFETFQSNRLKTRYKDSQGKMQLIHTLNGSALALPRIIAALLENNQSETEIKLPKVLHAYFGKEFINMLK